MNEDRYQQFRRAQVTNNRLFVRMLLCVAALSVVLVILDASTDTATGLAGLAEILIGVATILCMVVVIVTMGLFLVVLNVDTYVRPRDRSLPSWGGWARLTKRVAIRVLLFTWLLVPFALIPLDTVGFFALDFGENALYDWAIDPIRFVGAPSSWSASSQPWCG